MEKSEYQRMYQMETSFWWYRVLHELVDHTIRKNMSTAKIHMLDAGCGTGRMMEICQKYGTVHGIDYSSEAVSYARKRGLKDIEMEDLNHVRLPDNFYDVIVCLDVLYHSAIMDDKAIVKKFTHSLKEGGLLIINLPAFEYLKRSHDVVVHTKKRYRKTPFEKEVKESGLQILKSGYRMPLLYLIILLAKMFHKESTPNASESDLKAIPGWLNRLLLGMGRCENWFINHGMSFSFGSSLFVVARKPIKETEA